MVVRPLDALPLAPRVDLDDFIDRPNGKLSAGQKTRVALAKALTEFGLRTASPVSAV